MNRKLEANGGGGGGAKGDEAEEEGDGSVALSYISSAMAWLILS